MAHISRGGVAKQTGTRDGVPDSRDGSRIGEEFAGKHPLKHRIGRMSMDDSSSTLFSAEWKRQSLNQLNVINRWTVLQMVLCKCASVVCSSSVTASNLITL